MDGGEQQTRSSRRARVDVTLLPPLSLHICAYLHGLKGTPIAMQHTWAASKVPLHCPGTSWQAKGPRFSPWTTHDMKFHANHSPTHLTCIRMS